MNILPSFYKESTHVFEQTFLPALTDAITDQLIKTISMIVLIAFSCIAAGYMIYSCIQATKIKSSSVIFELEDNLDYVSSSACYLGGRPV